MIVIRDGTQKRLLINQEPPENFVPPAVDPLFRSVAHVFGAGALAVVLTGMGQDGRRGCQVLREAGAQILVQDEATSVVGACRARWSARAWPTAYCRCP